MLQEILRISRKISIYIRENFSGYCNANTDNHLTVKNMVERFKADEIGKISF